MGIVRMGPPEDIVLFLKTLGKIKIFIETGTWYGWTSYWASKHFEKVITIEFSEKIFKSSIERHKKLTNVEFIYGRSPEQLNKLLPKLNQSAIFWLDAHWCSMGSYGENDQCPLIEELKIINNSKFDHIILIDDARFFLGPPPLPNSMKFFPSISEIIILLNEKKNHVIINEDVIICVPNLYKLDISKFMQQKITINNTLHSKQLSRKEKIKKLTRLLKKIICYKFW